MGQASALIGELARHIINVELRLSSDRTAVDSMQEKNLREIKDDLGDIFYILLKMAIGYNIDLEARAREHGSRINYSVLRQPMEMVLHTARAR